MRVSVRRAGPTDLDAIAPLFGAYRQFYEQPADPARARVFVAARLDAGDTVMLIAEQDGAAVGFTHLLPSFRSGRRGCGSSTTCWLRRLRLVAPDARRQGVAEALLPAAAAHGRATDSAPAQAFYRRLGWTPDHAFVTFERTL